MRGGHREAHSVDYHASRYRRCRMGWAFHLLLYLGNETMMPDDDYLDDARDQARLMADDEPDGEPPIRRVNDRGWAYIKEWILATQNEEHNFDTGGEAAEAWCSEAEESMGNGNPPMVEMQAIATLSGSCETFTVPDDGVYECDPEPNICPACSGSGEGMHEGTRCVTCKGDGEC